MGEGDEEEGEEDGEAAIKKYKDFNEAFGKTIKLGIIEDTKNRKKLAKLLRFESTHTKDGETVSLSRYVKRMKEGQKHIYYIAGENKKELETSPFLEKLKKRGDEVIFMTDPIDEYAVQHMDEFEDNKLMNASKEDLKFGDKEEKKEKKRREKAKENLKDLIEWYKKTLGERVEKIIVSNRLPTSPMAVVTDIWLHGEHGASDEGAGAQRPLALFLHGVEENRGNQPLPPGHPQAEREDQGERGGR